MSRPTLNVILFLVIFPIFFFMKKRLAHLKRDLRICDVLMDAGVAFFSRGNVAYNRFHISYQCFVYKRNYIS